MLVLVNSIGVNNSDFFFSMHSHLFLLERIQNTVIKHNL